MTPESVGYASEQKHQVRMSRLVLALAAVLVLVLGFFMLSIASPGFARWVSETWAFEFLPQRLQNAYGYFCGLLNEVGS